MNRAWGAAATRPGKRTYSAIQKDRPKTIDSEFSNPKRYQAGDNKYNYFNYD
jgi:hypothetical protein